MNNELDRVDYRVNPKSKTPKKLSKWQMVVFVSLIVIILASSLIIIFLSFQVNDLRQQNEILRATNEALQELIKSTPRP